jgi:DNA-binding XRE family transcriptional regulator
MAGRPHERPPSGYVTVPNAAKILGVTAQTVRNWMKNGRLDGKRGRSKSGEPRYFVESASLEEALARNGVSRLSSGNQEVEGELATCLDAMSTRQEDFEKRFEKRVLDILETLERQEQTGAPHEEVSALREQLRAEQAARRAAEIERDLLRNMLTHSAHQAALQSFDTPIEPTTARKNVSTENSEAGKKQGNGRIDRDKIKSLRKTALLNQQQLAERAGLNAITISKIESGKRANPRPDTIRSLAKALGVELEELVTYS